MCWQSHLAALKSCGLSVGRGERGFSRAASREQGRPVALCTREQTSAFAACIIGPMTTKFSESEVRSGLRKLTGWTILDGKLHREYKFADFIHPFGFMTSGAMAAEAMGHHPGCLNVYNRLTVDLTSHDVGGISAKDLELAGKLNALSTMATAGADR
jgi:4a-hydroxytetrahydrobiopterin dehydratase